MIEKLVLNNSFTISMKAILVTFRRSLFRTVIRILLACFF